jgi:hypothetical protein
MSDARNALTEVLAESLSPQLGPATPILAPQIADQLLPLLEEAGFTYEAVEEDVTDPLDQRKADPTVVAVNRVTDALKSLVSVIDQL